MSQQPKALRLAELCRSGALINNEWDEVADELTRLHAVESGAKVELMRRDNLIDSLHGLCESYRAHVESLQVEISRLQSAPVAAVPAMVPLTDERWLEYLLKYADASILDLAAYHGESIQDRGLWRLRGYANSLRKLVESAHGIGLTVGDGGQG